MSNVYILGAGGQAREIYQIYSDNGPAKKVKGFVVTVPCKIKTIAGKRIYDSFDVLTKKDLLICAVGNSFKRNEWIKRLEKKHYKYDTIIHNSVVRGRNVEVGEGSMICAGSVLTCDIRLGKHILISIDSTISHDVEVGDFVTLSPGANIGGRVKIGEGTFIGLGASVIQDVKIGRNCFIGAGAVIVNDIPDNTLAYGIPAKQIRKIRPPDWNKLI